MLELLLIIVVVAATIILIFPEKSGEKISGLKKRSDIFVDSLKKNLR